MAKYSVLLSPCNCNDFNCKRLKVVVDTDINTLVVGNVYSFSSITDCSESSVSNFDREPIGPTRDCFPFGCYVVDEFESAPGETPNVVIVNSYGPSGPTGCEDCVNDISNYLTFINCFTDNLLNVPIDQITPTPVVEDYYFLDYVVSERGDFYQAFGCFRFIGRRYIQPGFDIIRDVIVLSAVTQTDCQSCLESSPILYVGYDCLDDSEFFVALPSEGLENHLITYTDLAGLTQYCGVIKEMVQDKTPDVLFVSDLGLYNDETNNCDACLAQSNEKKELINCLEPITEVVWASSLFNSGNSTHLSKGDGCYEIGATVDPSTPITLSELANFEPQENCEDCLECYGVIYEYTSCEELEICGPTNIIVTNNNSLYSGRDFVIDSNNFMFIPFRDSGKLGKYNLTTQTFDSVSNQVLSGAESVAVDEGNGVICVSNRFSNYVTFFDYNNLTSSFSVTTLSGPRKVYYEPIDGYFYVTIDTCCSGPGIVVYSGASYNTMVQIATFGVVSQYRDIVRVGSNLYVLNSSSTQLEVWSKVGLSYTIVSSINLGTGVDSLTYDSTSNVIYIKVFSNYYLKYFIGSSTLSTVFYPSPCGYGEGKIMVNNSTNRIYITDSSCNIVYEFDKTTDTIITTYSNLNNNNITQVYGIGNDTSNNTWFGSYDDLFSIVCELGYVNGSVTSNEYLPTGTTFFNYSLSACCEITSIQSITDTGFVNVTEYPSMLHYEDCISCTSDSVEVFICQDCNGFDEGLLIAPSGTHNVGDFVRSRYGNSDFICLQITGVYTNDNSQYVTFVSDGNSYTSCEECSSGSSIGLTIINCDTLVPSYVNVSLSEWSEISGFPFSLPNSVISDSNGTCYQVVNSCPIDNNNPEFKVSNFYYNQSFCRASNQSDRGREAGSEYFECVICCDCGSTGSTVTQVSPPHPVWTDGYGTPVTQMGSVTLGGMFGLNN